MTDARMPGPWLHRPEYWELSDRAWRTLGSSLMLSAEQGTDGRIGPGYLTLLHPDGLPDHVTAELVARGHWERTDDGGIQVIDWAGVKGQSTAAEVEANRARKRRNQAAYRARQAAVDAKQAAARPPRPPASPGRGAAHRDRQRDRSRDRSRRHGEARLCLFSLLLTPSGG